MSILKTTFHLKGTSLSARPMFFPPPLHLGSLGTFSLCSFLPGKQQQQQQQWLLNLPSLTYPPRKEGFLITPSFSGILGTLGRGGRSTNHETTHKSCQFNIASENRPPQKGSQDRLPTIMLRGELFNFGLVKPSKVKNVLHDTKRKQKLSLGYYSYPVNFDGYPISRSRYFFQYVATNFCRGSRVPSRHKDSRKKSPEIKIDTPRKLTWNLKITCLKRKINLPNLHFWVPC